MTSGPLYYPKTKVVATIGPASQDPETIRQLLKLGVRLFRLNFKHNTKDWHISMASKIKQLAAEMSTKVGVILDLQGPSVRVRLLQDKLKISVGERIQLVESLPEGGEAPIISITYPHVLEQIPNGTIIYTGDGELSFKFERDNNAYYLIALDSGTLRNGVAFSAQGVTFVGLPVLTERDKQGVELLSGGVVDFLALSFVNSAQDVQHLKDYAKQAAGASTMVISKIESMQGIENIDEILEVSEAIMVARGDLALQTPYYHLTYYQKFLIQKAREYAKPVIVATQMLNSMIDTHFPTRAEISDVANSVLDAPDALMLSGETAIGTAPVKSVQVMQQIVSFYEDLPTHGASTLTVASINKPHKVGVSGALEAPEALDLHSADNSANLPGKRHFMGESATMARAAATWARDYSLEDLRLIVVFTNEIRLLDHLATFRPHKPVMVVTQNPTIARRALLRFGVQLAVVVNSAEQWATEKENVLSKIIAKLVKVGYLKPFNRILVLEQRFKQEFGASYGVRIVKV